MTRTTVTSSVTGCSRPFELQACSPSTWARPTQIPSGMIPAPPAVRTSRARPVLFATRTVACPGCTGPADCPADRPTCDSNGFCAAEADDESPPTPGDGDGGDDGGGDDGGGTVPGLEPMVGCWEIAAPAGAGSDEEFETAGHRARYQRDGAVGDTLAQVVRRRQRRRPSTCRPSISWRRIPG